MTYLLDTNLVSDVRRRRPLVEAWLQSVQPSNVYFSVITLGEIECGIAIKERTDPVAAQSLEAWAQTLRRTYAERILPVTEPISIRWGRLAAIRTRGEADGLIAATALVHGLTIVTRNTADFDDTGAPVLNPWTA